MIVDADNVTKKLVKVTQQSIQLAMYLKIVRERQIVKWKNET